MVQHILTDISNYLKGRGRWAGVGQCGTCGESLASESGLGAGSGGGGGGDGGGALEEGSNTCSTCGGVAQYYEQEHLAASERSERAYYEGHGAGNGDTFTWVKAFSDGCAAQFMCAAFLLFLSTAYTNLGIHFSWNWFCSCHVSVGCGSVCTCGCAHIHIHSHTQGKCDCDPEGGALKTAADAYENKDDPRADQRKVIRNAAQLVRFGREHMTKTKKDFYSKRGTGVYRRWTHLIPVRGCGAIQRHRVKVHTISTTTTINTSKQSTPYLRPPQPPKTITMYQHCSRTHITTRPQRLRSPPGLVQTKSRSAPFAAWSPRGFQGFSLPPSGHAAARIVALAPPTTPKHISQMSAPRVHTPHAKRFNCSRPPPKIQPRPFVAPWRRREHYLGRMLLWTISSRSRRRVMRLHGGWCEWLPWRRPSRMGTLVRTWEVMFPLLILETRRLFW